MSKFSIRSVIRNSVTQYQKNFKQFLFVSLAVSVIAGLWIGVRLFMEWLGVFPLLSFNTVHNMTTASSVKIFLISFIKQLSVFSPLALTCGVGALLLYGALYFAQEVVLCTFSLRVSAGSKVTLKNIFSGIPFYGWFIAASLAYLGPFICFEGIKFFLGSKIAQCGVIGLVAIQLVVPILLYWFVFPLYLYGYCMIDKKLRPLEALCASYRLIKKARIRVFFLYVLTSVLVTVLFGMLFSFAYATAFNLLGANLPVVFYFLQGLFIPCFSLVFANVYHALQKSD